MSSKSPKNRGLGRGLGALFAEQQPIVEATENRMEDVSKTISDGSKAEDESDRVVYIDLNNIKPNDKQPRKYFNEEKLSELALSIKEHGIIQPLVIRSYGEELYEIVAGERRWRAARMAGYEKVPCLIRNFTDEENMLIAIIENLQREDLNPIEEAQGLEQMIKAYGMTQDEVSRSISKSRPYISNSLRLLKLPEEIQEFVISGDLSMGHARTLISVLDKKNQMEICNRVISEKLSVRETEKLVALIGKPTEKKPKTKVRSPEVIQVENQLKEKYGTKVSIKKTGKKGLIQLEYYSVEELNRLLDMLV